MGQSESRKPGIVWLALRLSGWGSGRVGVFWADLLFGGAVLEFAGPLAYSFGNGKKDKPHADSL
ncbi:hypothetical protein GCM10010873_33330 [Cypionkella aquatica]|uniref:Uncharacterized protein n=1 Tax=Cypionkella aquatica TaxID=1756042 RepID=A0AA37U682_9RHOB|nr:hypothetical protein GCM10010873_33330 [Cypionkella aquatica]